VTAGTHGSKITPCSKTTRVAGTGIRRTTSGRPATTPPPRAMTVHFQGKCHRTALPGTGKTTAVETTAVETVVAETAVAVTVVAATVVAATVVAATVVAVTGSSVGPTHILAVVSIRKSVLELFFHFLTSFPIRNQNT
jgi:hypothetical protein